MARSHWTWRTGGRPETCRKHALPLEFIDHLLRDMLPQDNSAQSMELENGLSANTGSARLAERAKYIPLRLNPDERRLLRLLEVSMIVLKTMCRITFSASVAPSTCRGASTLASGACCACWRSGSVPPRILAASLPKPL